MGHKEKISSSNKIVYILILSAGLVMALTVLFSLFMGLRTNFIYSTLLNSAFEIKSNMLKARTEFIKNIEQPSQQTVRNALEYLEFVEYNAVLVLDQKDATNILPLSIDNNNLKVSVQKLQVLLFDYRALSLKISSSEKSESGTELRTQWEQLFNQIENKSNQIEKEIHTIVKAQVNNFRITQFVLIGISLILSFSTIFVLYRSEKIRVAFIRKIENANIDLEKGLRKTTRIEEALQKSQRQLDTLIQNLPGMVYRCGLDRPWGFEFVSDKCLVITGYKAADFMSGKSVPYYDLIHPDDKKKTLEQVRNAVEEKKPYQLVYRITTTGGYEKWVWEQGVGIFSEKDDELVALEGFITDITEQKTGEDQISLQSNALEAAANSIVISDVDGKVIWVNSAFTKLTGYTSAEIFGKSLRILDSGIHPQSYYDYIEQTIKTGEIFRGELINRRKDGSLYTEELTITPVKNLTGEVIYYVEIKQDVTERKNAEEALRESELRFRGLYENATIGIYRTTPEGKILMANPTLQKILGYDSFEELANLEAMETYVDPKAPTYFKSEIEQFGKIFGFETKWRRKDGSIIYVRESARAVKDDEGKILYYEGTLEDINDKKRIEEALVEAKEHAEQSDKLKSEFLAQMSHEIRTPLNVILSFTGMMKEELQDKVDDELKNAFDVIEDEGRRIMRTVELILNMSELQTGSYSYRSKKIDLFKDVLQKSHKSFQKIAEKKKILFGLYNNSSDTIIEADEYSVMQVFHHLIENAIKYTSTGKIDITIGQDPHNNLYVDVVDTGIGIASEFLPNLFSPFTREEQGYTRNFEGNGLGLALAKKYCDLNRAEIKATSIKGKGSTFRVTFPKIS